MPHRTLFFVMALFSIISPWRAVALACPDCDPAIEARADVMANRPAAMLLIVAAPFLAVFAIAAATARIGRPKAGR